MNQEDLARMINDCISRLQDAIQDGDKMHKGKSHGRVVSATGKCSIAAASCISPSINAESQFTMNNIMFSVTDVQPENMLEPEWVHIELIRESGQSISGFSVNIDEKTTAIFAF